MSRGLMTATSEFVYLSSRHPSDVQVLYQGKAGVAGSITLCLGRTCLVCLMALGRAVP